MRTLRTAGVKRHLSFLEPLKGQKVDRRTAPLALTLWGPQADTRDVSTQPKIFIAMPFGRDRKGRLDHEDESSEVVTINFDAVWKNLIQPAIPTKYEALRADEDHRGGPIDRNFVELLYTSEIVIADLTFGNPNVFYELGMRHALRPSGTILIACDNVKLPFDVRNQTTISYPYFNATQVDAFKNRLKQAIHAAEDASPAADSPVYVFLSGLSVSCFSDGESPQARIELLEEEVTRLRLQAMSEDERRFMRMADEANSKARLLAIYGQVSKIDAPSKSLVDKLAVGLRDYHALDEALVMLDKGLQLDGRDPELLREKGFTLRLMADRIKGAEGGRIDELLGEARSLLEAAIEANPYDSEALGMLGGLERRATNYSEAFRYYRSAYELDPDNPYMLVTVGAMSAAAGDDAEARLYYGKLQETARKRVEAGDPDTWTYLNLGEAYVALGEEESARVAYQRAIDMGAPPQHLMSAASSLAFFRERGFQSDISGRTEAMLRKAAGNEAA